MDGVSKGGKHTPLQDTEQKNQPQTPGSYDGRDTQPVDGKKEVSADPDRPFARLHLEQRSVSDTEDTDWENFDDESSDRSDIEMNTDDEGYDDAEVRMRDENFEDSDVDMDDEFAYSRPMEGDDSDSDVIFLNDESSSGFGSESDSSRGALGMESDSAKRPVHKAVSLGHIPDKDSADKTEVLVDNVEPETQQRVRVIRHLSLEEDKGKNWITRQRSAEAKNKNSKEAFTADHQEALMLKSLDGELNIISFRGFKGILGEQTFSTELHLEDGGQTVGHAVTQLPPEIVLETLTQWLYGLANGLSVLKRHHILHRDIKPDNLLVDMDEGIIRIADLGNAHRVVGEKFPSDPSGSAFYAAPEVKKGGTQYYSADVYAAGMTFVDLMMRSGLLTTTTWQEFYERYQKQLPISIVDAYSQHPLAGILSKLTDQMIDPDLQKRPAAEEIIRTLKLHLGN